MNGPRTNQFVAPTSFITSISRRRAKIDSRIVFAISSVDAVTSSTTAIRKTIQITSAIVRTRCAVLLPQRTSSTPAHFACCTSAPICGVYSPFVGVTTYESGSGFDGSFDLNRSGYLRSMILYAWPFETKTTVFTRLWSARSFWPTAYSCCGVAVPAK